MRSPRIASAGISFLTCLTVSADELTCRDIAFKDRVTKEFSEAAEACHSVVERDGRLYARFVADVVRVRRNGTVTLDIKTTKGSRIRQTFKPPSEFRVRIDGRPTRVRELRGGQEIRIYLRSELWEVVRAD